MRRLGLDIGTNSIGWCLTEYDEQHESGTAIVDIGARIFSDGRDPKSGASLAVDRRAARGYAAAAGSVSRAPRGFPESTETVRAYAGGCNRGQAHRGRQAGQVA